MAVKEYTTEHLSQAAESLVSGPKIATFRVYIGDGYAEATGAVHIVLDNRHSMFQSTANYYGLPVRFVCEETGDDRTWLPGGDE